MKSSKKILYISAVSFALVFIGTTWKFFGAHYFAPKFLHALPQGSNLSVHSSLPDTPLDILKVQITELEKSTKDVQQWRDLNDLYLQLSRYYYSLGQDDQAQEYLKKISSLNMKEMLIQAYATKLARQIQDGAYDSAIDMIKQSKEIHAFVNNLPDTNEKFNIKPLSRGFWYANKTRQYHDQIFVNQALCTVATKAFLAKDNLEYVDILYSLPQCHDDDTHITISTYKTLYLLQKQLYAEAYQYFAKHSASYQENEKLLRLSGDMQPCTASSVSPTEVQINALLKEKDLLIKSHDDRRAFFLAKLLMDLKQTDAAFSLAVSIQDKELQRNVTEVLYRRYVSENNEQKSAQAAKILGLAQAEPVLTGGFGTKDPAQWHVMPVMGAQNIPLAFKQFMEIKNDRARFTALAALNRRDSKNAQPDVDFSSQIIQELERIAANETDAAAQDVMYAKISLAYTARDDIQGGLAAFKKIKMPQERIGSFDVFEPVSEAPLNAMVNHKDCMSVIKDLPDYIDGALQTEPERGRFTYKSERLISCQYASGVYKEIIASGTLKKLKDEYLSRIVVKMKKDKGYAEQLDLLALMDDPQGRADVIKRAFRSIYAGYDAEQERAELEKYKNDLALLDAHPVYRNDENLWAELIIKFLEHAIFNKNMADLISPYFKNWPDFEKAMQQDQHFYSKYCAFKNTIMPAMPYIKTTTANSVTYSAMTNLPNNIDLLPNDDFTSVPTTSEENVYRRCIRQGYLLTGDFVEAIHMVRTMFPDPKYTYEVAKSVLELQSNQDLFAYNLGSMKYPSGYMWAEDRRSCPIPIVVPQ